MEIAGHGALQDVPRVKGPVSGRYYWHEVRVDHIWLALQSSHTTSPSFFPPLGHTHLAQGVTLLPSSLSTPGSISNRLLESHSKCIFPLAPEPEVVPSLTRAPFQSPRLPLYLPSLLRGVQGAEYFKTQTPQSPGILTTRKTLRSQDDLPS